MKYHSRGGRAGDSGKKYLRVLIVLAIFGIVAFVGPIRRGLSHVLLDITGPTWSKLGVITEKRSHMGAYFQSKKTLREENEALNEMVRKLSVSKIENEILKADLANIEAELGVPPFNSSSFIPARVIRSNVTKPLNVYIANVGESSGVSVDDLVYVDESVAVAKVVDTSSRTAKFKLLSSLSESFEVIVGDNLRILLTGGGANGFSASVPQDVEIDIGMTVRLPGDLLSVIGRVSDVRRQEGEAFQDIRVESPVNLQERTWVSILPIRYERDE